MILSVVERILIIDCFNLRNSSKYTERVDCNG